MLEILDIHKVDLDDTALFDTALNQLIEQDFEAPQREALSAAVRDNLPKFPVEMQAHCQFPHFCLRILRILKPDSHGRS